MFFRNINLFPSTHPLNEEERDMSVEERIQSLKLRHTQLDNELEQETHRPHPDDLHIAEIKRQKLRLKDEIAGLRAH